MAGEDTRPEVLLAEVQALRNEALAIMFDAEESGHVRHALTALRMALDTIESTARLRNASVLEERLAAVEKELCLT